MIQHEPTVKFCFPHRSVERLVEYGDMQGESDATGAWAPETGTIVLDNLGCRYRDDLPRVLCNVSASLKSGSNVGVVGGRVEINCQAPHAIDAMP